MAKGSKSGGRRASTLMQGDRERLQAAQYWFHAVPPLWRP